MYSLVVTSVLTALTCALVTFWMIRVRVMDVPGSRSSHIVPIPKGGGIGILAGYFIGLISVAGMCHQFSLNTTILFPLSGIVLLAVFSWLDDLHAYPALAKLAIQCISVCLVLLGTWAVPTSPLDVVVYVAVAFCLLVITNALNFIDGLNGLASGCMFISAAFLALCFQMGNDPTLAFSFAILGVALLSFIPFNFPHAKIFMGDVGSQSVGLAIGWGGLMIGHSHSHQTLILCLLSGILFDVIFTLIRRGVAGDPLMQAHRSHLYQLAVRSGMPAAGISILYWTYTAWGGAIGLTWLPISVKGALILIPQFTWMVIVIHRATRSHLGKW